MKIVISVLGTRGDAAPMLALGHEFAARGHDVAVSTNPGFEADAEAAGVRYVPTGLDPSASLRAWGGPGEKISPAEANRRLKEHRETEAVSQFELLPPLVEGADLVVGAGLPLAARSVAEAFGVPYRFVGYCPQALPSAEHPPVGMPWLGAPLANRFMWASSGIIGRVLAGTVNPHRARLGLPPLRDAFVHALGRDLRPLIAADPELAPLPRDCAVDVVQTPAIATLDRGPLSPSTEAFLGDGEAPVYASFGSMVAEQSGRLAEETLAAVAAVGRRALVAPTLLAGRAAPGAVAALGAYEPHGALFPHVAAVVHHGGAGTFVAAARAGVPQVIVTHGWDQEYWGRRAAALGVAPAPLHVERLRPGALAEALRAALAPDVVARARELARVLAGRDGAAEAAGALLG